LHPPLKEVLILPLDASSLSAIDITGERCEIYGENLVDDRQKAMSCHGYSYARLYVRVMESALRWAAERGHEAVVRLLVEGGTDVNAKTGDGWTVVIGMGSVSTVRTTQC